MRNYQPTFEIKETAENIRFFMDANMGVFWSIVKPLVPYILVLYFMDALITALYMPESETGFSLGSLIAAYFYTAIAISWHRVIILGPDRFVPMDPFRPTKHEIGFIAVGMLLGVAAVLGSLAIIVVASLAGKFFAALGASLAVLMVFFLIYKSSFYFPAKAVDSDLTLKQSFLLTKDYFWKMVLAPLWASSKIILHFLGYFLFLFGVLMFVFMITGNDTGKGAWVDILVFVLSIPVLVYFQPLLTVIGVTSLSNYYMHAMQNRNDSVDVS